MSMIEVKNLKKEFGDTLIWQGIDAEINKGDCVCIIGPSGCGKSTFLRCLNLLEVPTGGQVFIDGEEITKKGTNVDVVRRKMGMVYQSFNLFSHKTVLENVILAPMLVNKVDKNTAMREGIEYLRMVGMTERADYMPDQLSGGQKQRAAIARCLAMKPEVILFDEPTSALDPTMVDEVLSVIRTLVKKGMTCVIVTHEMNFARNVATQIFYMDDHGFYEKGTPEEIFEHPKREKTIAFVNRLKVLEYEKIAEDFDFYEFIAKVSEYCLRYSFTSKQANAVQMIAEELVEYRKKTKPDGEVGIHISYDNEKEQITLTCLYEKSDGNLLEQEEFDAISLGLIKGFSEQITYSSEDNRSCLTFRIR